jgi:transcriptional regulator with XRE-family HTH domain
MNKDNIESNGKTTLPLSGFAEEHRQEVLPLDFVATGNSSQPQPDAAAETAGKIPNSKIINTAAGTDNTINDSAEKKVNAAAAGTDTTINDSAEKKVNAAATADLPAEKAPMMEATPATAAKHRSLLQSESPDKTLNEPGMPQIRSAAYPPGYIRKLDRGNAAAAPAIGASADEKVELTWRKNEIIERSEPQRAAAAIIEKKNGTNSEPNNDIQLNVHLGKMLNEARARQNLSFQQVEDVTKISKSYLDALEREDFSRLPPPVFICAYVRKLCNLYKVNQESTEQVINELKKYMEVSLSEEIMQNIEIDRAKSPESEAKLRNLLWMGFAAIILFAGIISLALLILFAPGNSSGTPAANTTDTNKPFDPARLDKLRPPALVGLAELPAKR